MRTLVINTYGGSLLLGAQKLGLEIIGSYEDTGFGLPIQQANFPHLDFKPMRKDWPTQDLSEVFVIAHPPCSAFSVQNSNPAARGVDSAAFACTKSVLNYAMQNKALGIAIESVVGALAGAWHVHQKFADEYGYNLYRVLENGCMFGAQWRDRFWSVFIKKGAAPEAMNWSLAPRWATVRQVVGQMEGPSVMGLDAELEKLQRRFVEQAGCSPADMAAIFDQNVDEMESVDGLLWERKFKHEVRWDICKRYVTSYASSAMVHLPPHGLCPVLLGSSWWYMDGRNLTEAAYKLLMGFPETYTFPEGDSGRRKDNYRLDMRTYLSKGVMPPIASWVLENSLAHLGALPPTQQHHIGYNGAYQLTINPNFIADFRIRKKTWGQDAEGRWRRPALRHEDEHGIAAQTQKAAGVWVDVNIAEDVHEPKQPRVRPERVPRVAGPRRSKSPWNAPEIEESLKETLFVRPNTADAYALYESHGYHRMGVKPGDVMLDFGAHIGCVASRAALVGAAKIICVEAEPANFALLQQNTRSFQMVETIHGAVFGGDTTTVKLHTVERRDDGGHSTGTHSAWYTTRGKTIEVPRVDFRQLLEQYQPTVVKMDVEGSEFTLDWTNLPLTVRSIGLELHTRRETNRPRAKEIVQTLADQGFKPVHNLNMESNFSAIVAFFSRDVNSKEQADEASKQASNETKAEPVSL
jgi:FkbM family methyltransferase